MGLQGKPRDRGRFKNHSQEPSARHPNMELIALLLGAFTVLIHAAERSEGLPTTSEIKNAQVGALNPIKPSDVDDTWRRILGLGTPAITKTVMDFNRSWKDCAYLSRNVLLPEQFDKSLMVAGKWGLIIPLAGYQHHQIEYEHSKLITVHGLLDNYPDFNRHHIEEIRKERARRSLMQKRR